FAGVEEFAAVMLGKRVVRAKDTPNFMSNRIGVFAALLAVQLMQEFGLTIEEVDRLTGTLIGRPKTATFRTMDMVGIDIVAHVAKNVYDNAPTDPEREVFRIPLFVEKMIERKMLGAKTGGGFYRKEGERILSIDAETLQNREQRKPSFPALEMVAGIESLSERLPELWNIRDRATDFVRKLLMSTFMYAAWRIPEISSD